MGYVNNNWIIAKPTAMQHHYQKMPKSPKNGKKVCEFRIEFL